jgi:hypothetical protein
MRRIAATTLGLLALATFTAACGDDSSSADTGAPANTETATGTEASDTAVDETVADTAVVDDTVAVDETGGGDAPGEGTDFCALNDDLNDRGDTAMNSQATPDELQAFFENDLPDTFAELTAAAPAEIADDLATAIEGFNLLAERLAANEWDLTAAFSDPATAELMNDPKYTEAGNAIDAFCGG